MLRWEVGGGMRQNADTHTKRVRTGLALALPDGHWGIALLSPRSSSFIYTREHRAG